MNIYIHIPFCHSKCAYCAFLSHCNMEKEDEYVKALCFEIENFKFKTEDSTDTLYFGGGTPSLVKAENVAKIIQVISTRSVLVDDAEISLECNPEDITKEKLKGWKAGGINRLSIGIQTFNDKVRKTVGRNLTSREAIERVKLAQKYFENIGIDLISSLPGDSYSSIEKQEAFLKTLSHVSLYDLETENDSVIGKNPERFDLSDEEKNAEMLISAWNMLEALSFEQYEISNFARNENYCRHNLDFWQGKDYLGFGLGATSRIGNQIFTNSNDFSNYLADTSASKLEKLTQPELKQFNLLSAIRLNHSFKKQLMSLNGNRNLPKELLELDLVTTDYILTQRGKLLYNQVVDKLIG